MILRLYIKKHLIWFRYFSKTAQDRQTEWELSIFIHFHKLYVTFWGGIPKLWSVLY